MPIEGEDIGVRVIAGGQRELGNMAQRVITRLLKEAVVISTS
jgi:hypothetical protein